MRHRLFNYLELDLSVDNFLTSEDRETKIDDIMIRLGLEKTKYVDDVIKICNFIAVTKDEDVLELFNTTVVLNNIHTGTCELLYFLNDKIRGLAKTNNYEFEILAILHYLLLSKIKDIAGDFNIKNTEKHMIIKKLVNIRISRYECNLKRLRNISDAVLESYICDRATKHNDLISLYAHIS